VSRRFVSFGVVYVHVRFVAVPDIIVRDHARRILPENMQVTMHCRNRPHKSGRGRFGGGVSVAQHPDLYLLQYVAPRQLFIHASAARCFDNAC
jgi:hypothetical protein